MKIFCVGRNYADHAKELKNEVPTSPVIFSKPPTALLKGEKPFYFPEFSKNIHFECELVLRICKNGKHIAEKFANKYYEEVYLGIDFTARDLQTELKSKGLPWELAKGFDGSAVLGDKLALSALPNSQSIKFELHKNGEVAQQGDTADMLFHFDKIINFISQYFTLQTGDLIYTGTPAGVGPVSIGDVLEGYLEGNKVLHCAVK